VLAGRRAEPRALYLADFHAACPFFELSEKISLASHMSWNNVGVMEIPWRDAHLYVGADDARFTTDLFRLAEDMLKVFAGIYGLSGGVPPVMLVLSDDYNAEASETKLSVNWGVSRYACEVEEKVMKSSHPPIVNGTKLPPGVIILYTFLWVVAHEFFHYAQGHRKVLEDHPEVVLALEYDADLFAVAALFRFLCQRAKGSNCTVEELKCRMFYGIYWPIREQIGSTTSAEACSRDHPSYDVRLWNVMVKLVQIDCMDHNMQKLNPNSDDHFPALKAVFLKCERQYCDLNKIPFSESSVRLNNRLMKESLEVVALYTKTFPLISKASRLTKTNKADPWSHQFSAHEPD
jgi:hypothetical protein